MHSQTSAWPKLTALECEVIRLASRGYSHGAIVHALGCSPSAVKHLFDRSRRTCLYHRLDVDNEAQLVAWWSELTCIVAEASRALHSEIERLYGIRNNGDGTFVIEESGRVISILRGYLDRHPEQNNSYRYDILKLLTDLLIVQGLAIADTSRISNLSSKLRHIMSELNDIYLYTKELKCIVYANCFNALIKYHQKDYETYRKGLDYAVMQLGAFQDPYVKIWPIAGVMISSAYLSDHKRIQEEEARIANILDKDGSTDPMIHVNILRNRGRAWGLLGDVKAVGLLEQAWSLFEAQSNKSHLEGTRLMRTTLQISERISGAFPNSFLKAYTDEWLQIALGHNLQHYVSLFHQYLKVS